MWPIVFHLEKRENQSWASQGLSFPLKHFQTNIEQHSGSFYILYWFQKCPQNTQKNKIWSFPSIHDQGIPTCAPYRQIKQWHEPFWMQTCPFHNLQYSYFHNLQATNVTADFLFFFFSSTLLFKKKVLDQFLFSSYVIFPEQLSAWGSLNVIWCVSRLLDVNKATVNWKLSWFNIMFCFSFL